MSSMIRHKGAIYVKADSVEGFLEDLNTVCNFCESLPHHLEAMMGRAKKLGLTKTSTALAEWLLSAKILSKKTPPNLVNKANQETQIAVAASTK